MGRRNTVSNWSNTSVLTSGTEASSLRFWHC